MHQLLKLSWEDFLTEIACLWQYEEDFTWEASSGIGKGSVQPTISLHEFTRLTREM